MCFLQWEVATGIEECGDDGMPRPPSRRSYYPAPSPPARLVPMPKFSLSQAGTETPTTSTPPPRTTHRASRVRSQSPIRRVARHRPTWTREWTTSRYSTRLRKECLTSWWTLLYQEWHISFENEVVTRSRELSVFYRDCGRRYPSLASCGSLDRNKLASCMHVGRSIYTHESIDPYMYILMSGSACLQSVCLPVCLTPCLLVCIIGRVLGDSANRWE